MTCGRIHNPHFVIYTVSGTGVTLGLIIFCIFVFINTKFLLYSHITISINIPLIPSDLIGDFIEPLSSLSLVHSKGLLY